MGLPMKLTPNNYTFFASGGETRFVYYLRVSHPGQSNRGYRFMFCIYENVASRFTPPPAINSLACHRVWRHFGVIFSSPDDMIGLLLCSQHIVPHSRSMASLGSSLIFGLFLMFLARLAYLPSKNTITDDVEPGVGREQKELYRLFHTSIYIVFCMFWFAWVAFFILGNVL